MTARKTGDKASHKPGDRLRPVRTFERRTAPTPGIQLSGQQTPDASGAEGPGQVLPARPQARDGERVARDVILRLVKTLESL
jgi:hypothetical protein